MQTIEERKGMAVKPAGCPTIITGPLCYAGFHPIDFENIPQGAIILVHQTGPDWLPIFDPQKYAAIVTQEGGRTCHAAIVGRDRSMPVVVGIGEGVLTPTLVMSASHVEVNMDTGVVRFIGMKDETPEERQKADADMWQRTVAAQHAAEGTVSMRDRWADFGREF